jgi:hypothetical protein
MGVDGGTVSIVGSVGSASTTTGGELTATIKYTVNAPEAIAPADITGAVLGGPLTKLDFGASVVGAAWTAPLPAAAVPGLTVTSDVDLADINAPATPATDETAVITLSLKASNGYEFLQSDYIDAVLAEIGTRAAGQVGTLVGAALVGIPDVSRDNNKTLSIELTIKVD